MKSGPAVKGPVRSYTNSTAVLESCSWPSNSFPILTLLQDDKSEDGIRTLWHDGALYDRTSYNVSVCTLKSSQFYDGCIILPESTRVNKISSFIWLGPEKNLQALHKHKQLD